MSSFTMTSSSASLLSSKVRCPTLDMMLRKTILALCEVNVRYNLKLEVSGSLHIRSDDDRVLTCLIDEQLMGPGRHHLTNTGGLPNYIRRAATSATVQPLKFLESMEAENSPVDLSGGGDEKNKLENSGIDEKYNNMTPEMDDDKMKLLTEPAEDSRCEALPNGKEPEPYGAEEPNESSGSPACAENESLPESNGMTPQQDSAETTSEASDGQQYPMNGVANMSPVSSEKSLPSEFYQEEQYMVLDLSNTSETTTDIRCVSVNGTTSTLNGMAMNAVMQNDMITHQMAALSQMAEMMQRNVGMVLPTPAALPNAPLPQSSSTPSPQSQSPPTNTETEDTTDNKIVKIEPQDPNSAVSPAVNQNLPQMLVNPINSASRFNLSAVDPLTIGNPVQTKTGAKKWQCVFCGILVSSKFYLSSHINAVHTRTRIYPCEMCGKIFYSHGAQRIHKLRNHWVEKRHKCPHCGQLFVLPFELRQHITRKHKHIVAATPQPQPAN